MEISSDKNALLEHTKRSNVLPKVKLLTVLLIIFGCIIITLAIVNLWQAGYLESSDTKNDSQLTTVCNGNGHRYDDTNLCECYECYGGNDCEEELDDCVIGAGSGQPHLFVEYWTQKAINNEISPMNIPIDYRVAYQNGIWSFYDETQNTTFFQKLNQVIRRVHKKYHNVDIDGKYIVYGVGAAQLTTAAYVAWSRVRGAPIIAYDEPPFYFEYPDRCDSATPYHCTFSTSSDLYEGNDTIREVVTIPNNPDGFEREQVYSGQSSWALDLVYYWPHFYDTNDDLEPKQAPVVFFSFTKLTGHAASRFGWAVVESEEMADTMRRYIARSTLMSSIESLRRAWDIFHFIEQNGDEFFDYVRNRMKERWEVFNEIFEGQNNFIQRARVGSQYGWVECVGYANETEIVTLFQSYKISPYWGSRFGTPGFVRFNLAEFEGNFKRIMNRFKKLVDDHR